MPKNKKEATTRQKQAAGGITARAARIFAARMAWNPVQSEVARQMGIAPQLLNNYEAGRNELRGDLLAVFCAVTRTPPCWIVLGTLSETVSPRLLEYLQDHHRNLLREAGGYTVPVLTSRD